MAVVHAKKGCLRVVPLFCELLAHHWTAHRIFLVSRDKVFVCRLFFRGVPVLVLHDQLGLVDSLWVALWYEAHRRLQRTISLSTLEVFGPVRGTTLLRRGSCLLVGILRLIIVLLVLGHKTVGHADLRTVG